VGLALQRQDARPRACLANVFSACGAIQARSTLENRAPNSGMASTK
jgi:hypothetical protein